VRWKAGKQVDDEDLRELMKENGIGRPSHSLMLLRHKRQYIIEKKKQVIPHSYRNSTDRYDSKRSQNRLLTGDMGKNN
jgi:reverse gyrase